MVIIIMRKNKEKAQIAAPCRAQCNVTFDTVYTVYTLLSTHSTRTLHNHAVCCALLLYCLYVACTSAIRRGKYE